MTDFNLNGYTPEKVTDGFEILKGTFKCVVNFARIETYSGDKDDFKGIEFFRYELEIAQDEEKAGRKLWKSVALNDDKKVKKLADTMFTLGLEFKNKDELAKVAEEFVKLTLEVRAWGFTPQGQDEKVQTHIIKGVAKEAGTKSEASVPF